MTRSAYVQVRCAVVALWSERHQRYATKTGPETSNLTQNYGFAGSRFSSVSFDDRPAGRSLPTARKIDCMTASYSVWAPSWWVRCRRAARRSSFSVGGPMTFLSA